ncbi:MAG: hypothetical protein ACRC2T_12390 [Thermoguttaceae bacterium]
MQRLTRNEYHYWRQYFFQYGMECNGVYFTWQKKKDEVDQIIELSRMMGESLTPEEIEDLRKNSGRVN